MIISRLIQIWAVRKPFFEDKMNLVGFGLSLCANLAAWAILYFKLDPGLSNILLHYSAVYGSDLVGPGIYAYGIAAGALIILIINLSIASSFYQKEKLASYFLAFASLVVQLIFLAASAVLTFINA
ncbi:MAG: hypothetical protein A3J07_03200 [Candidatus Doudnabacteria bacterium RIFCSPLOWO2_02_FULL_49_13]|uniref:Uncharacterized protein n=1 Tax=Candidatus Doudnabacteria bacterium RIFCSPHIGHO2_12_FULL_48_16 TaxID=1817838 RepID=A0A1F5PIB6_9BACT|nr:MAG: hypothetical protein A3B77_02005 [Candidatus Doudnabacteria bacterium RIFCSPHIGHO2_02_FULL_49_24]OGE89016.1 MAG: hypothetical protein A2760_00125 [Candidatus Doudnabacteria bacterium RIFCSPHIGHO2_01_FULL_50_67]OGE89693.1 MAG: hypothetical protein A3E29_00550 [Candidatus Doudnabacteria bacterium RIFCSPHIGHO2_12_FULL_48_16]OGE97527.1 MAG: hypothetical protein A2990_02290 [Candidatus Doudnabacteria bacterium RIFCSPLOWO2_01_FULL_49_40]OGF03069.1 MAG: hypothetical protein A3J07_03200 [Candid